VASRSKARVCGRLLAGIAGSNVAEGMVVSLVRVVRCQVEVSALGRSLVQRSPTDCGVSECDGEATIMRRPWCTVGCCCMGGEGGCIC
jgi:2-methylaconitate cis-trans-isomerase PrpF